MAEITIPAAPQAFTFNGRSLQGVLTSFSGQTPRRYVVHEFPKRAGALIEDQERGPRRLEVRLSFVGDTAAGDYQKFETAVGTQPRGLLIHPIAGRWQAFCAGPQEDVSFDSALNEISVRVLWIESALDASLPVDVPDVASAAQTVTAQMSAFQSATASFMGNLAKLQVFEARAIASIDSLLDQIDVVTDPVDFMTTSLAAIQGIHSSVIGRLNDINVSMKVLASAVSSYTNAATDLFNGDDSAAAGMSTSVDTLLGNIVTGTLVAEAAFQVAVTTPAGAAENVGQAEETLAACYVLSDALKAAKPPIITFLVPDTTDLVSLCQRRFGTNAVERATEILSLNRIPNPAAIPGGTRLLIPSK